MNQKNLKAITTLRHKLHQYPELSMQENKTIGQIRDFLQNNTAAKIFDKGCWFYALIPGKDHTKKIAFRADMDALPMMETTALPYRSLEDGVSHKCGHDGHCAVLCGLAMELSDKKPEHDVYLIFQPGEEIGAGAKICRQVIQTEGISEIFAFHNLGGFQEGSVIYRRGLTQPASEGIRFSFQGKTSHASAPEEGKNPAASIAKMVLFANNMADANSKELSLCTVTGIHVGTGDFGISPGDGKLDITLRASSEKRLSEMEDLLRKMAEKEAGENGFSLACDILDVFPETRNHDVCLNKVIEAANLLQIPTQEMQDIWRASEDFGWYLKECPGAMVYIGNGTRYAPLHTSAYDFNDRILETAVDLFVQICQSPAAESSS